MIRVIHDSIIDLIGNTPLVQLCKIGRDCGATLLAKLELFNPISVKDRPVLSMIEDAERRGMIDADSTLIEATSGNTGMALAYICAVKGYRLIICMSEAMSDERKRILKAFGAELVLTPTAGHTRAAKQKALQLAEEIPNSFYVNQHANPANTEDHGRGDLERHGGSRRHRDRRTGNDGHRDRDCQGAQAEALWFSGLRRRADHRRNAIQGGMDIAQATGNESGIRPGAVRSVPHRRDPTRRSRSRGVPDLPAISERRGPPRRRLVRCDGGRRDPGREPFGEHGKADCCDLRGLRATLSLGRRSLRLRPADAAHTASTLLGAAGSSTLRYRRSGGIRMRVTFGIVVIILAVLVGVAAAGNTVDLPHVALCGGVVLSVAPAFDVGVYLAASYSGDLFGVSSTTTLIAVPDLFVFEELTARYSPDPVDVGVDVGLGIVPFSLDTVNVWAEVPVAEEDIGQDTRVLFTADVGGRLWFGAVLGGDAYVNLAVEIPGEAASAVLESETWIGYGGIDGFVAEEELEARLEFLAPRFFDGQLLTENDLTQLACYVTARIRLDSGGLSVPGIVIGLELSVKHPLAQDP